MAGFYYLNNFEFKFLKVISFILNIYDIILEIPH